MCSCVCAALNFLEFLIKFKFSWSKRLNIVRTILLFLKICAHSYPIQVFAGKSLCSPSNICIFLQGILTFARLSCVQFIASEHIHRLRNFSVETIF